MNKTEKPITPIQVIMVIVVYGAVAYQILPLFYGAGVTGSLVMIGTVALFGIVGFRRVILAIAVAAMGLK